MCNYGREKARTLLQGAFVEAEGTRSFLWVLMPVNSWSGSGAMWSSVSQGRGKGASHPPIFMQTAWLSSPFVVVLHAKSVMTCSLSLAKDLLQILAKVSLFIRS